MDEVLGFIRQHRVKLEEVRLGELDPAQEQIRKKLVAEKTALKSQYDAEVERLQIEHEAAEDKRIEAAKAAGEPTIPEDAHLYESVDDYLNDLETHNPDRHQSMSEAASEFASDRAYERFSEDLDQWSDETIEDDSEREYKYEFEGHTAYGSVEQSYWNIEGSREQFESLEEVRRYIAEQVADARKAEDLYDPDVRQLKLEGGAIPSPKIGCYYDLVHTRLLISGGDGNQWVRRTFERFDLKQEYVLDRFLLNRAARRAIGDRVTAQETVKKIRQEGFPGVKQELERQIGQASGIRKEKLQQFYHYLANQQEGLLDLSQRGYSDELGSLGAIEGNVDKRVIHRMMGRGCCWRLRCARAMLALCQHKETLQHLAFQFLPLDPPEHSRRRKGVPDDRSQDLVRRMPIFYGPDQDKPWVEEFYHRVHAH